MILYKRGDILKSEETFIIHGCNCFNTMGAGIAAQIKQMYPEAYAMDCLTSKGDKAKLGQYTVATGQYNPHGHLTTIVNLYTQFAYGRGLQLDYEVLYSGMRLICTEHPSQLRMAMPKIGCGLAGGKWEVVESILAAVAEEFERIFYIYEL